MSVKITKEDVKYIASLARISLSEKETELLTGNLSDILKYIEKLEALDTSDVEPTSHVIPLKNVYREDKIDPSLSQDEALSISEYKHQGSFKVPQVIE